MKEKTYAVRIFDGTYTTLYTVKEYDITDAEIKAVRHHMILNGGQVVSIKVTDITNQC